MVSEYLCLCRTDEEKAEGRRLVVFKTEKSVTEPGHVCTFRHVPTKNCPVSRRNGDVIVSCIFWAEKNEYYITAVDMVYLLENFMGAEFNQEEKDRIRGYLQVMFILCHQRLNKIPGLRSAAGRQRQVGALRVLSNDHWVPGAKATHI